MTLHFDAQTVLIVWLAISGLMIAIKGLAGTQRTYGLGDAVFGVAEIAFLIWLVTVVAR